MQFTIYANTGLLVAGLTHARGERVQSTDSRLSLATYRTLTRRVRLANRQTRSLWGYCNAWCMKTDEHIFGCQKKKILSPGKAICALKCIIKILVYNPLVHNPPSPAENFRITPWGFTPVFTVCTKSDLFSDPTVWPFALQLQCEWRSHSSSADLTFLLHWCNSSPHLTLWRWLRDLLTAEQTQADQWWHHRLPD